MSDFIRPARRKEWVNLVPDRLLLGLPNRPGIVKTEYIGPRLSLRARAIGAWLEGRADNWVLNVEAAQNLLGIKKSVWQGAARELIKFEYLERRRSGGGYKGAGWIYEWIDRGVEFDFDAAPTDAPIDAKKNNENLNRSAPSPAPSRPQEGASERGRGPQPIGEIVARIAQRATQQGD